MMETCTIQPLCTQEELIKRLLNLSDTKDAWLSVARECANTSKYKEIPEFRKLGSWLDDPLTEEEAKSFAASVANYVTQDDKIDTRDLGSYFYDKLGEMIDFQIKLERKGNIYLDEAEDGGELQALVEPAEKYVKLRSSIINDGLGSVKKCKFNDGKPDFIFNIDISALKK